MIMHDQISLSWAWLCWWNAGTGWSRRDISYGVDPKPQHNNARSHRGTHAREVTLRITFRLSVICARWTEVFNVCIPYKILPVQIASSVEPEWTVDRVHSVQLSDKVCAGNIWMFVACYQPFFCLSFMQILSLQHLCYFQYASTQKFECHVVLL